MKFERIVRETLVMGGQARIRDTGITVNEIVRMSLSEKSQAEILERFPQLEAGDVHQAMGYSMDDTIRIVMYSSNDGRTPLTAIQSFIDLILSTNKYLSEHNDFKKPTEQQKRHFLEVAVTNAGKAQFVWQKLYNSIILNFGYQEASHTTLEDLLHYLTKRDHYYTHMVQSKLNLQLEVNGVSQLSDVLHLLLGAFAIINNVVIKIREQSGSAIFKVEVQGELMDRLNVIIESYFSVGLASLALFLSDSKLIFEQMGDKIIFEFALPIAENEA